MALGRRRARSEEYILLETGLRSLKYCAQDRRNADISRSGDGVDGDGKDLDEVRIDLKNGNLRCTLSVVRSRKVLKADLFMEIIQ